MQTAIPTTVMRGGTSKGLFFHRDDLPTDAQTRDNVLLAAMGSPDARQIDGLGGGHPLTSKVAILSPSTRDDADIDYLFLQVNVDTATVSDSQPCGNILAGVAPWAIDNGLIQATGDVTSVRINTLNNGAQAVAHVQTPGGIVSYEGDAHIDGVPGTAAPIPVDYLDIAGSNCGALLPTGNVVDNIGGTEVTCIDNGMPVVCMRARDLGLAGKELPSELEANAELQKRLERIRLRVGPMMNLGDVTHKTVPKMTLLSEPTDQGTICTRSFIPHRVHESIGVLAAVSVATACLLPNSVAADLAKGIDRDASVQRLSVDHPTGSFAIELETSQVNNDIQIIRSALLRTARRLMRGEVYIPASVWPGLA